MLFIGSQNSSLKVLYSNSKQQASASKSIRHIPQSPERILDAPDIIDDYCAYTYYDVVIFVMYFVNIYITWANRVCKAFIMHFTFFAVKILLS